MYIPSHLRGRHLSKHLSFVCNFTHISSFKGQQCYLYFPPPTVLSEVQSDDLPSTIIGKWTVSVLELFLIVPKANFCSPLHWYDDDRLQWSHLRTYSALILTWKECVCTKLMLWLSLFYEGLSMKMNNMNVFWPTHIQQMPSDQFTFIHPQALQIVGNPINGWKKRYC